MDRLKTQAGRMKREGKKGINAKNQQLKNKEDL